MNDNTGVKIVGIADDGPLAGRVSVGDFLIAVNGNRIADQIDYHFHGADDNDLLLISFRQSDGANYTVELPPGADAGIELEDLRINRCRNNCIFCYVNQMPPGISRKSLLIKDDDYRLSFLFGSYITLSNLSPGEKKRIVEQRLGPLYISVHATDELVRERLLGRSGLVPVLDDLGWFALHGIEMNIQIVAVPGINDGPVLDRSLAALSAFYPAVSSIAVVPVGLTRYHNSQITLPVQQEAAGMLEMVLRFQKRFLDSIGTSLVYPSDDLILRAGGRFPQLDEYEELSQLENGVGMVASFLHEAGLYKTDDIDKKNLAETVVVTGTAFAPVLFQVLNDLKCGSMQIVAVKNRFFGESVTTAGLLTGSDIITAFSLRDIALYDRIIIPDIVFNNDNLTIDNMRLEEINEQLGNKVVISGATAGEFLQLIGLHSGSSYHQ